MRCSFFSCWRDHKHKWPVCVRIYIYIYMYTARVCVSLWVCVKVRPPSVDDVHTTHCFIYIVPHSFVPLYIHAANCHYALSIRHRYRARKMKKNNTNNHLKSTHPDSVETPFIIHLSNKTLLLWPDGKNFSFRVKLFACVGVRRLLKTTVLYCVFILLHILHVYTHTHTHTLWTLAGNTSVSYCFSKIDGDRVVGTSEITTIIRLFHCSPEAVRQVCSRDTSKNEQFIYNITNNFKNKFTNYQLFILYTLILNHRPHW